MIANLFYRRPRLTVLMLGLIVVAGLAALNSIPRQEDPALTERFGGVVTYLPGASAGRVEALITEKIENALQEIAEIKRLSSRSQTGISSISIQLDDDTTQGDVDAIWSRVRDKVAEVEGALPEDATVPEFTRNTTAAYTLLVAFTWEQDGAIQMDLLLRLTKDLEQKLSALAGTKEVDLYGEPEEEILVTVDAGTMSSANVTVSEISRAIARADPKVSAGRLQGRRTNLIIEVTGQLDSINRIRNIPLRRGDDGQFLSVGDIARVEKMPRDPPTETTIIHGKRGIILAAKMETNRRVGLWAASARKIIDGFRETLPSGV
jgi:multidrug efflux pump